MQKLFVGHLRPRNIFKLFSVDVQADFLKRGKYNRQLKKYECFYINREGSLFLKSTCLVYLVEKNLSNA